MKILRRNPFLIVLIFILVLALALSCQASTGEGNNGEEPAVACHCPEFPGRVMAEQIGLRVEDLPPGWHLIEMDTADCTPHPLQYEGWVETRFADAKPWAGDSRRSINAHLILRWEEDAAIYYFSPPEGSVATNITGADEAYIAIRYSGDCAYGARLRFRKDLYDVTIYSYNLDLRDLCIQEGAEVDAEIAFVIDLAEKVSSRIP